MAPSDNALHSKIVRCGELQFRKGMLLGRTEYRMRIRSKQRNVKDIMNFPRVRECQFISQFPNTFSDGERMVRRFVLGSTKRPRDRLRASSHSDSGSPFEETLHCDIKAYK